MIPFLFAEGRYNARLEAIMDLPKGSTIWLFDQTDMARAKETVGTGGLHPGQRAPFAACMPAPPKRWPSIRRKLIDVAGKDGGFILDVGAVADEGKDENLETMVKTAKEYGVY